MEEVLIPNNVFKHHAYSNKKSSSQIAKKFGTSSSTGKLEKLEKLEKLTGKLKKQLIPIKKALNALPSYFHLLGIILLERYFSDIPNIGKASKSLVSKC